MKRSEIYLRASELLASGASTCGVPGCGGACCAISKAAPTVAAFTAAHAAYYEAYGNADWWNRQKTPERQADRILAMLFMSAISADEERHG